MSWLLNKTCRRRFLHQAGGGAAMLALASMLKDDGYRSRATAAAPASDLAPKPPHFKPKAKRVIWLFMHGGPSHVDLFDPKPDLRKFAGKPLPESFGAVMTRRAVAKNPLLGPIKPFQKRGESGLEISDFLPHIAENCADDICVIRSMHGDSVNHPQSVYQLNTGSILMGQPSVGSWVTYGLGTVNQNMPGFVVLPDPGGGLKGGPPAWGNAYLPATYQGVTMRPGKTPILDCQTPENISSGQQRGILDLVNQMNQQHSIESGNEDELSARIAAYELAFRMQTAAPGLVDINQETQETHRLYGIDQKETRDFGTRCLLARRMIERGVRFVQVYSGNTNGWDAHKDVLDNHTEYCQKTDKPVAGLIQDLKRRGMLDDTLVIWGGEFGRMPMSEQGKGRDHNPWGFSYFLAGASVKQGFSYGATDPIGLRAAEDKVHVRDFHATVLHLLGLNYEDLSYYHHGLEERLTGPTEARIVKELFS